VTGGGRVVLNHFSIEAHDIENLYVVPVCGIVVILKTLNIKVEDLKTLCGNVVFM